MSHDTSPYKTALTALCGVPETMLITLAARVVAPIDNPDLGFRDPAAEEIAQSLDFDPHRFRSDKKSMRGAIIRAQWFDRTIERLVETHPQATCISMGSGLDIRKARLSGAADTCWVDVELPVIHDLRINLVPPAYRSMELAATGSDAASWLTRIPSPERRPIIFFAEGVLLYLAPADVWALLHSLVRYAYERDAQLYIIADFAAPLLVRASRLNPSVKSTGARFSWGINRPTEITRRIPQLVIQNTVDLMTNMGAGASIF